MGGVKRNKETSQPSLPKTVSPQPEQPGGGVAARAAERRERGGRGPPPPRGLIYRTAPGCCRRGRGLIVPRRGLFLIEQPERWDLTRPNGATILFPAAPVNEACRLLPASALREAGAGRVAAAAAVVGVGVGGVISPRRRSETCLIDHGEHASSWRNRGCRRPFFFFFT